MKQISPALPANSREVETHFNILGRGVSQQRADRGQSNKMRIGILAAIFAAFVWSMNFVVPFVVGKYTIFDLALVRFGVSSLCGAFLLASQPKVFKLLSPNDWLMAAWLAFLGYVGYFLAVTGSAIYAGPIIAPAFLGLVPVVVALAGNLKQRSVPWRHLAIPLMAITLGLLLVNRAVFTTSRAGDSQSLLLGIPLAILAVLFWTWFALLNQTALAKRPHTDSVVWTAMMLVTGGIQMILFLPIGLSYDLFGLALHGAGWEAHSLYIWGSMLALLSSLGGAWAWTVAARRLPIALSAQLVVLETVFGVVFGLMVHNRLPDVAEAIGITLLIAGVVLAIRIFYGQPDISRAEFDSNGPSTQTRATDT